MGATERRRAGSGLELSGTDQAENSEGSIVTVALILSAQLLQVSDFPLTKQSHDDQYRTLLDALYRQPPVQGQTALNGGCTWHALPG